MTTQTELRALLEDAAYAMGFTAWCFECNEFLVSTELDVSDHDDIWYVKWQPHLDSADGAEIECALEITIEYGDCFVEAWKRGGLLASEVRISDYDSKQSARRMASLRVAAAIGRAKRENGQ